MFYGINYTCIFLNLFEIFSFYFQNLGAILYETREQNKSLQFEVEDLKQKLHDAQGDIKVSSLVDN